MTRRLSRILDTTAEAASTPAGTEAPVSSKDNWLEIKHETLACEWAFDHGWLVAKLQWVGQTGWPDRTFIKNGVVVFIEFKKKKGGRRSPKQIWWVNRIKAHGGHAYFCNSATEAIEILKSHD